MTIQHPVLGTLHEDPDSKSWESDTAFLLDGYPVDVSVWPGGALSAHSLERVARFAGDLAAFDRQARAAIREDHDSGDQDAAVPMYLDHHRDLLDGDAPELDTLLGQLRLCHVGLHPDEPDAVAVFDYSIDEELTQYLLVVTFDDEGAVVAVDMES
jgi:hypothetical protein